MSQTISRGLFFLLFLFFSALAGANPLECPLCGMSFKATAKTSFLATHEAKPLPLCSFACAVKLFDRKNGTTFHVLDFSSGKQFSADKAFFLVKSKNLLKELEFDMPPSVVAFLDEAQARAKQKTLGDGEVVHGWKALKKTLAP